MSPVGITTSDGWCLPQSKSLRTSDQVRPSSPLRAPLPTRQEFPETGVPDDRAYLSADNRDEALDSRWWGPVPLTSIGGVVVARIGAPTTPWRSLFGTRGEPAVVPRSSKLKPV